MKNVVQSHCFYLSPATGVSSQQEQHSRKKNLQTSAVVVYLPFFKSYFLKFHKLFFSSTECSVKLARVFMLYELLKI